jgi:hypothetical protein
MHGDILPFLLTCLHGVYCRWEQGWTLWELGCLRVGDHGLDNIPMATDRRPWMRNAKELRRTSRVKGKPSGKPVGPPGAHRGDRNERMTASDTEMLGVLEVPLWRAFSTT